MSDASVISLLPNTSEPHMQPRGVRYPIKTHGDHCVCELSGCDANALNDLEGVRKALLSAAEKAGATVLDGFFHRFDPIGVSGLLCLSESHLSVHTWPESGYAAVDIYTCGGTVRPAEAIAVLAAAFKAQHTHLTHIDRGLDSNGNGIYSHAIRRES